MYNKNFIFEECGFEFIPSYINRDLLFNVSYDTRSGKIKLYVLDDTKSFLYKISEDGITQQHDAVTVGADPSRLTKYLGTSFNYDDLLLDTVEQNIYYMYVEETSRIEYLKFFSAICRKYNIDECDLVKVTNRINNSQAATMQQCHHQKSISLVKVPFDNNQCKLYARPFLTGNQFDLSDATVRFLSKLYDCPEIELGKHVQHLWVSCELFSDNIVVTSQYHHLYHD